MADALYRRLRVYARAGDLFGGLFDKKPGRGGARQGAGGARPGAGRPRLIGPKLSEGKPGLGLTDKAKPKKPHWPHRECPHEKPVFANGKLRKHCFDCYPKPEPKPRKNYEPKVLQLLVCAAPGCTNDFVQMRPGHLYCCGTCRNWVCNRSERHKLRVDSASRGCRRGLRLTRKHGGKHSKFNVSDVFLRDGWSCRACGIPTPTELRGLHAHNSPELDHVIPLSRGGDHSVENTQCLCRSCNLLKSNRTMNEFVRWMAA